MRDYCRDVPMFLCRACFFFPLLLHKKDSNGCYRFFRRKYVDKMAPSMLSVAASSLDRFGWFCGRLSLEVEAEGLAFFVATRLRCCMGLCLHSGARTPRLPHQFHRNHTHSG